MVGKYFLLKNKILLLNKLMNSIFYLKHIKFLAEMADLLRPVTALAIKWSVVLSPSWSNIIIIIIVETRVYSPIQCRTQGLCLGIVFGRQFHQPFRTNVAHCAQIVTSL